VNHLAFFGPRTLALTLSLAASSLAASSLALAGCAQAGSAPPDGAAWALDDASEDGLLPEGAGGGGEGWLSSPLDVARVTSHVSHARGAGWQRYDCTALSRARHRGTDFGVASGNAVRAAAAGTVLRSVSGCSNNGSLSSSCGGGYGNHVILLHAGGYATLYAHLSPGAGQAASGARLSCGDLVGLSGNSGRSSGPHLHFEVRSGVTSEASFFSARALDPWGGSCSSQPETMWGGGSPRASCGPVTPRDDAAVATATYPNEVRGTPGMRLTQVFTVRNTGTTTWIPSEYALVHVSGAFREVDLVTLPAGSRVAPGQSVELRVAVTVPEAVALHRGAWRMARLGGAIFGREALLAVRVPSAPRACNSATLGREVPSGSCVQVDYAGCGATRCGWYACSDGAWLCTDGGACGGTGYPHDACTPPAPAPDGGTTTPGSCGSAGAPLGTACEAEDECCAGLECGAGEGGTTCCRPAAEACARHSDCCGDMLCTEGFCQCVPQSELCRADSECCDGLQCIAGACRAVTGGLEQASCGSREDCSHPLDCQISAGGGPTQCCVSGGIRCEAAGDCCGDMLCTEGRCTPRVYGESCSNLLDCAGALLCLDGVCTF
jgi:murein DD-endopeptidase MepM/ murein hydrolase activator NlpD